MDLHLAVIGRCVASGTHAVLTLDGIGWHELNEELKVPADLGMLPLLPYGPALNSAENIWRYL